jgi:exo-1,4-beta-D-glucosaminidase
LNYLAPADVAIEQRSFDEGDNRVIEASLNNKSNGIAFFVNVTLKDSANHTVYPVFWDDNYLSILPGESRVMRCIIRGNQLTGRNIA